MWVELESVESDIMEKIRWNIKKHPDKHSFRVTITSGWKPFGMSVECLLRAIEGIRNRYRYLRGEERSLDGV